MNFIAELTELCKRHGLERVQMLNAGACSDILNSPAIAYCEIRFEWGPGWQAAEVLHDSFHKGGRLI